MKQFNLYFNRQIVGAIVALDLADAMFEAWRIYSQYMKQGNCTIKAA
jgi:hypothetical protein